MYRDFFSLLMVTLFWQPTESVRLSIRKRVFQSSTVSPLGSADHAVDGSLKSDFSKGSCIQTQKESNPWWMVDLGSTYLVSTVVITNREDCCHEEINGALILIGDLSFGGGRSNPSCATISSLGPGETKSFSCGMMKGQYITITIPGFNRVLNLCEVQVFGQMFDSSSTSHPNTEFSLKETAIGLEQTKKAQTSQSTVFIPSQFPYQPMNGSSQSGHCVQTLQEDDPWWMVDLGSTQIVDSVSITNRKDCCHEQINGVIILVGDSFNQNGKLNSRCATVPSLGPGTTQILRCGTIKGRYVTITKPGRKKILSFCNVQIFGKAWDLHSNNFATSYDDFYPLLPISDDVPETTTSGGSLVTSYNFDLSENKYATVLSRGKPAFQSSIFSPSGSPERAVDGSLLGDFEKGTCIQTKQEINPWWMVDLGSIKTVKSVAITTRKDCCTEELLGALIMVGNSSDEGGLYNTRCAVIDAMGHGKTEFFRCGMIQGRYVSVVNPKRGSFLSLCEVRVFGKAPDSLSPGIPSARTEPWSLSPQASKDAGLIGPVLPKQRQTSQSSVFIPSHFPERPMDGSVQSDYCVQTLQENEPWWMIDLGSTKTVGSVSITNRKDCCHEQIKGTMILVGNSPEQGGKLNPRCAIIPSLGLGIKHVFSCGAMNGRYVTIIHPGRKKVLSFCDVKVFEKTWNSDDRIFQDSSHIFLSTSGDDQQIANNSFSDSSYNFDPMKNNLVLSKGKPAFQSSISSPFGTPERAVDGSLLSDFEKGTCIHTQREVNPWWMVDLGSIQTVRSVAITTRKDCCTQELHGALILVGDFPDNGGIFNARCAIIGFLDHGKTEFFKCGTLNGRYVSIFNPGKEKIISLCEVQVFGKTPDSLPPDLLSASPESHFGSASPEFPQSSSPKANNGTGVIGSMQQNGVQTSQSSVFIPPQFPAKPMDGSIQSGHCVQTLQENDPWWMADLGSTQAIESVSITNRKDCCYEQIKGAMILVGDLREQGGKLNARCAIIPSLGKRNSHILRCGQMKGRYVTITHPGKQKVLSFCDVKIFVSTLDLLSIDNEIQAKTRYAGSSATSDNFDHAENYFATVLSKGKPAFQSSIFTSSGSPLYDFEKSTCIQTQRENNPWWMVDLGLTQTVKSVTITIPKDCCAEELHGALILVGDSPDHGGTLNARCAVIGSLSHEKQNIFRCRIIRGRYVSIFNPGRKKMVSLCKVQVFGEESYSLPVGLPPLSPESHPSSDTMSSTVVSRGKPAFQSSISSLLGSPERAVDGSLLSDFNKGSCIQTYPENDPWWMVDLGSTHIVESVSITSRRDCCSEEMNGAKILVGNSEYLDSRLNPSCAVVLAMEPGKTKSFSCGSLRGRYVTITIPGKKKFLTLCEVQVFGKVAPLDDIKNFWEQNSESVTLLSRGKSASQSSASHLSASPERALDMSFQNDFGKSSCIQTLRETDPWWMVDLGSTYPIDFISLTDRDDCCHDQISEAVILVGDSSYHSGKFNLKCTTIFSIPPRKTAFFNCGSMMGRYVTIIVPGKGKMLTLCKVQIFGKEPEASLSRPLPGINEKQSIPLRGAPFSMTSTSLGITFDSNLHQNSLALLSLKGKSVSQSSIFNPSGSPERAVDGSLESDFSRGSCIQTRQETDPWWMIDLKQTQSVESVTITNRRDCCHEQINGAEILIGDSSFQGGKSNPRCATIFSLGPGKTGSFNCEPLRGRYVTITIPGKKKLLTFCEVQVFIKMTQSSPDIQPSHPNSQNRLLPTSHKSTSAAFGRGASAVSVGIKDYIRPCAPLLSQGMNVFQSSISSFFGSPERAVDGSLAGDFSKGSCIQTLSDYEPWWTVDLGSSYNVDYVAITNRKDCCHEQLNGAVILVGDSSYSGGKFNPRCATISSLDPGRTESFFCGSMSGRYVTITIPGRKKFLTFCEVQVFGKPAHILPHALPKPQHNIYRTIGVNIALWKISYQSSTFHPLGSSDKAIDGNKDNDFYKNSCTHTNDDFEPWWMVDLTSKFIVDQIMVIPRGDRCMGMTAKYEIRIGDSRENGGKSNLRCGEKVKISPGQKHIFKCDGMQGRFVTVIMPEVKEFLSLCEVEVFGKQLINSEKDRLCMKKSYPLDYQWQLHWNEGIELPKEDSFVPSF